LVSASMASAGERTLPLFSLGICDAAARIAGAGRYSFWPRGTFAEAPAS
jgi:hypothetical protein